MGRIWVHAYGNFRWVTSVFATGGIYVTVLGWKPVTNWRIIIVSLRLWKPAHFIRIIKLKKNHVCTCFFLLMFFFPSQGMLVLNVDGWNPRHSRISGLYRFLPCPSLQLQSLTTYQLRTWKKTKRESQGKGNESRFHVEGPVFVINSS